MRRTRDRTAASHPTAAGRTRTGHDYVEATVIRSANAATVVCTGRHVADERAAQALTDIEADSYPALDMSRPDPQEVGAVDPDALGPENPRLRIDRNATLTIVSSAHT